MSRFFKSIKYKIPTLDKNETLNFQMDLKSWETQDLTQPLFDAGVHSISMLRKKNNINNSYRRNNFHKFLLLLQGELNVKSGNQKYLQKPGMLSFCPKNHTFLFEGKGLLWYILINLDDNPIWDPLVKNGSYLRDYESTDYMLLLSKRIFYALEKQTFNDKLNALEDSSSLADLLRQENRIVSDKYDIREDKLNNLIEKIQLNPEDHWTVPDMAKAVHLSPRSLNRFFHHEYGMGPMDFVINKRLDRAIDLLINTNEKIEDISNSLNYKSVYSFSNLFLRHVGMRPGVFRNKHYTGKK